MAILGCIKNTASWVHRHPPLARLDFVGSESLNVYGILHNLRNILLTTYTNRRFNDC